MTRLPISIALATFNGASFIEQQLASLARQSYLPAELVVSDDGSTDETLKIVENFRLKAPFPVMIMKDQDRLGYSENFLRAVAVCTADLIAFCDQDDIWMPEKLALCADAFQNPKVHLVHHNASIVDAHLNYIDDLHECGFFGFEDENPWDFSPGFTQVFRRGISDVVFESIDVLLDKPRIAHDQLFFFISQDFGPVVYINKPLVCYRQHGSNVFGWAKRVSIKRRLRHCFEKRNGFYNYLSAQAAEREKLMHKIKIKNINNKYMLPANLSQTKWKNIKRLYQSRARVYGSGSMLARACHWGCLVKEGGYSKRQHWTFGTSTSIADLAIGVCAGPLVSKYGLDVSIRDPACRKGLTIGKL